MVKPNSISKYCLLPLLIAAGGASASEITDLTAKLGLGLADGGRHLIYGLGYFKTDQIGPGEFVSVLDLPGENFRIGYSIVELGECHVAVRARATSPPEDTDWFAFTYDFTNLTGVEITPAPEALLGLLPDLPQPVNNVNVRFEPASVAPDQLQRMASQIKVTSIGLDEYAAAAERLLELCPPRDNK